MRRRFLEVNGDRIDAIRFVFVSVPSREGIEEYESGRFRGVTPLSWPAIEGGNPDTSVGRCPPIPRRALWFVSAGGDVLHAGSIPFVVSCTCAMSLLVRAQPWSGSCTPAEQQIRLV